ncbi:MAG TPA: (2Fe-2S)-binding protein [Solirubrobacteraceae bacterium]|nr:(2Fe-2S)-binding protein [Solirubrobacteraceae bacterium]
MGVAFVLDGRSVTVEPPTPLTSLAQVLRETLLLTGTKLACGEGFCGSCTVHLDGEPVLACLTPIALVDGRAVATVEGLEPDGHWSALQQAMAERDAVQCGMCFPGMLMTLTAFLRDEAEAGRAVTADSVRAALTGNVCRCTGYQAIVEATLDAAFDAAASIPGPEART